MNASESFRRARDQFHFLLDLDPAEREAARVQLCLQEPTLGADVTRLLAHMDEADLLARPAAAAQGGQIGPFEIIALLGRGGMGEVFEARRVGVDFDQRVALKVVQAPLANALSNLRFHRERAILARLSHPRIAHLIEGGIDPASGCSWFAMELVKGASITRWCDTRNSSIEQRLRLLLEVLEAVQFAHSHLIVHRDLKPNNVWVNEQGQVKLLDFGIAKLLDPEHSDPEASFYALTPNYSAPEQRERGIITTAVDICLLGLLARELLGGVAPKVGDWQDGAELRGLAATFAALTEVDRSSIALARSTNARVLAKLLRGDLGAIVTKACARDPAERYATATSFADDVRGFLENRPVQAARTSLLAAIAKGVRRNRLASAIAAFSTVALLALSLLAVQRARSEARERERAEAVLGFMRNVFAQGDPQQTGGQALSAAELLDRAASETLKRTDLDTLTQARIAIEVAGVFLALGESSKALAPAQRSLALLKESGQDVDDPLRAQIHFTLAETYNELGDWHAVIATADAASNEAGALDAWDRARLLTVRSWAHYMLGDATTAEAENRAALALVENVPELGDLQAQILSELATIVSDQGRGAEAIALLERAIEVGDASPGRQKLDSYVDRFSLAREYFRVGDNASARARVEAVLPMLDALVGAAHNRTVLARNLLAQCYMRDGDNARALAELEKSEQALATDASPVNRVNVQLIRSKLLLYSRQPQAAEKLLDAGIEALEITAESSNFLHLRVRWLHAESLLQQGRYAQAQAELIPVATQFKQLNGEQPSWPLGESLDSLARAYMLQGQTDAARPIFAQALAQIEATAGGQSLAAMRIRAHILWLALLDGNDPLALAKLKALRSELIAVSGRESAIQVYELDLLVDTLDPAASAQDRARAQSAARALQTLSGDAAKPAIRGLTSDS